MKNDYLKEMFSLKKLMLVMLLFGLSYQPVLAEGRKISMQFKNMSLRQALEKIDNDTKYHVVFSNDDLPLNRMVAVEFKETDIEEVLAGLLKKIDLKYEIRKNLILVTKKTAAQIVPTKEEEKIFQEKVEIEGVVKDESGEPLPGVNVFEKTNPQNGVMTNVDGAFKISVSNSDAFLTFSYIGYSTQNVSVTNRTSFNITLQVNVSELEEIVVVGYGTQKKVNLTGAVSSVNADAVTSRPLTSTSKALQGLAPGLTVVDRGGMAGSSGSISTIRGRTSVDGQNSPLVIVDGIEQSMDDINPYDIENISVLKDASSTAIYGSRGANGVILITTKRGKDGKIKVNYNGYYATQKVVDMPERVGIRDYMTLYNEAFVNDGQGAPFSEQDIENTVNGVDPYKYPNTDWHDVVFDPAPQHSHSVSASGGTDFAKFNLGVNYLDQEGILVANNAMKRYGVRLNTDFKLTDKLRVSLDVNMRRKDWVEPRDAGNVFWRLYHDMPPWGLPKLADGRYGTSLPGNNQLARMESGKREFIEDYKLFRGRIEYDITDNLKVIGEYNNRTVDRSEKYHQKKVTLYNADGSFAKNLVSDNYTGHVIRKTMYSQLRGLLEYQKTLDNHNLRLMLGAERESKDYQYLSAGRANAFSDNLDEINSGDSETDWNSGNSDEFRIGSYFGRLNYNFKEKYLLEANFRYDGSSRFAQGRDTRWGFFPSFSGAWKVSEEDFMKDISWLELFKLRASWGETGKQDNIGYWQYLSTIDIQSNYAFGRDDKAVQVARLERLKNEQITWETTSVLDIGFDIQALDGLLDLSFDYYVKNTINLLNKQVPISRVVGYGSPAQNRGEIQNKGWELMITHNNAISEDFSYTTSFTISDNTNEVIDWDFQDRGWHVRKEGRPLDGLYGYETAGFFKNQEEITNWPLQDSNTIPGDMKYVDRNSDGVINASDKMYLGDADPHFPISLNLSVNYKQFDFGMFWQGVLKQKSYFTGALSEGPNYGNFTHKAMLGRWTPKTAETATWPVLRKNAWRSQRESDFWVRDAAYIRLKNIQLGYTLPKEIVSKLNLSRVRLYVSADNLWTISQEELLDPEFQPGRVNYHPQLELYLVGININF